MACLKRRKTMHNRLHALLLNVSLHAVELRLAGLSLSLDSLAHRFDLQGHAYRNEISDVSLHGISGQRSEAMHRSPNLRYHSRAGGARTPLSRSRAAQSLLMRAGPLHSEIYRQRKDSFDQRQGADEGNALFVDRTISLHSASARPRWTNCDALSDRTTKR